MDPQNAGNCIHTRTESVVRKLKAFTDRYPQKTPPIRLEMRFVEDGKLEVALMEFRYMSHLYPHLTKKNVQESFERYLEQTFTDIQVAKRLHGGQNTGRIITYHLEADGYPLWMKPNII